MSLNKSKLTPESKRNVLEQLLQFVNQHKSDEKKGEQSVHGKNPSMLSFIKLMCVSKSFLIISCNSRFGIYRLSLEIMGDYYEVDYTDYVLKVYIDSKHYNICDSGYAMSIVSGKLSKLMEFFKPSFIGLHLDKGIKLIEVEHIFEFFRESNAKIGLFLNLDLNRDYCFAFEQQQRFDAQLEEFVSRINALECDVSYLNFETLLPLPLLDSLTVKEIKNFGQIARILRYKAKSLCLELSVDYFRVVNRLNIENISNSQLNSMKNTHVKSLSLHFWAISYSKSFILKMLRLFPNLTSIVIKNMVKLDEFGFDGLADDLVSYHEEMQGLKNCLLATGLKHVSVSLFITFYPYKAYYNNSWIKATRTKPEFADWNKETKYYSDSIAYSLLLDKQKKNCSLSILVYAFICGGVQNDDSNAGKVDDELKEDAILEDIANLFV